MFGKAPYESLIWERCVGASAFTVFLFICFPSFLSRRDAFGPTALAQTPPRPAFVTRRFGAPPLTAYFTDALVRLRHLELTRRPREPKLRDHNKSLPVRMCILRSLIIVQEKVRDSTGNRRNRRTVPRRRPRTPIVRFRLGGGVGN